MLPAIPVFGVLPPVGVADPWMLSWLALGAVAAVLAGVAATRQGHTGPLGALAAGAAAGVATALVYLGWIAASRGGLGGLRLTGLGPRMLEALMIGVPILVLGAVLAGMATWFVRRRTSAS
jgi:hypothetical protein